MTIRPFPQSAVPRAHAGGGAATAKAPPPAWATSALACLGVFVVILDATIVAVALPAIARRLGFGPAGLAWVVNAYTLAFAGFLLVGGRLVDRFGVRATFLAGLAGFGVASLACGLATAPWVLLAARAVQGVGGAALMPATLAMVTGAYPEGAARARALALWSAVGAAGAAAGTVLGGVLTDALGWRWVFLVNVPVAAAGSLAAARVLPAVGGAGRRQPVDLVGAALVTGGLVALVYAVLDSDGSGWGSGPVIGALAASFVLLAAFVCHQARWARDPLVPLSVFASGPLSAANAVIFCLGLGFFASPVLLSVYVQDALGYPPLRAGLAFLPAAAALFGGAQAAGRLIPRLGVRLTAGLGGLGAVAGFGWLSLLSEHTAYWPGLAIPEVLFGLGIGVAFTPITVAATTVAPSIAGVAAGILNTTRQVSGAIGLAVLTALADAHGNRAPGGTASGYDRAFLVAACAALVATVGAVAFLPGRASHHRPPP